MALEATLRLVAPDQPYANIQILHHKPDGIVQSQKHCDRSGPTSSGSGRPVRNPPALSVILAPAGSV